MYLLFTMMREVGVELEESGEKQAVGREQFGFTYVVEMSSK